MKNDNKLLDAIIDLGVGMKDLREEMKGMRTEQQETNHRLDNLEKGLNNLEKGLNNLEKEQHKTNILLAEHSRSIIKLAEKISIGTDHETRIIRLENAAFNNEPNKLSKAK